MTDRNDGRPRLSASHIHCAVPFFCVRSGTEGEVQGGAARGSGSAREGAKAFGGERAVRSAGLTHFRRSRSRARVLYIIRPPCHHREIAAKRPQRRSREYSSPAKTSALAPSAFALPRRRSHSPRTAFGLPSQQLSTMRCLRKVIHIVARGPVQNVLALAPAHAYI